MTNKYEALMVFSVKDGDEAVAALGEKFKALIAEHGTVDSVDEWGKRRLAYPIDHQTEGFYLLVEYTAEPSFPAELDRVGRITDGVLRLMSVKK